MVEKKKPGRKRVPHGHKIIKDNMEKEVLHYLCDKNLSLKDVSILMERNHKYKVSIPTLGSYVTNYLEEMPPSVKKRLLEFSLALTAERERRIEEKVDTTQGILVYLSQLIDRLNEELVDLIRAQENDSDPRRARTINSIVKTMADLSLRKFQVAELLNSTQMVDAVLEILANHLVTALAHSFTGKDLDEIVEICKKSFETARVKVIEGALAK